MTRKTKTLKGDPDPDDDPDSDKGAHHSSDNSSHSSESIGSSHSSHPMSEVIPLETKELYDFLFKNMPGFTEQMAEALYREAFFHPGDFALMSVSSLRRMGIPSSIATKLMALDVYYHVNKHYPKDINELVDLSTISKDFSNSAAVTQYNSLKS